jgi:hypothetical protein
MKENAWQDGSPDAVDVGRREFLARACLLPALTALASWPRAVAACGEAPRRARFFFTSQGKTGLVDADGGGLW